MNENGGYYIAVIPLATYITLYNLLQSSSIILERVIGSTNEYTEIAQQYCTVLRCEVNMYATRDK